MSWWGWAKELRILIGSDLTQTWKLSSWVWRNWRCGYGFVPWPPNSQCLPFSSWGQAYRRWFDTHITQEICGRYLGQNAQHRCCSWFLTTLNSLPTSLSFTMELPIDNKIFFYRHWNNQEPNKDRHTRYIESRQTLARCCILKATKTSVIKIACSKQWSIVRMLYPQWLKPSIKNALDYFPSLPDLIIP